MGLSPFTGRTSDLNVLTLNNIVTVIFRSHTGCKANRDRRLDNHYLIQIILNPCHIISLTHPFIPALFHSAWSADSSSIRTMNTDAASSARWSMSLPMRALWWMGKLICLRSTPSHLTPTPTAIIKSPSVWAKHSEMA